MHICYVDESGTPDIPGNTSHFVLAGFSIPIWRWRDADYEIAAIMKRYGLEESELHTAWLLRKYLEQSRISGFDGLSWPARRAAAERERNSICWRYKNQARVNPTNNKRRRSPTREPTYI